MEDNGTKVPVVAIHPGIMFPALHLMVRLLPFSKLQMDLRSEGLDQVQRLHYDCRKFCADILHEDVYQPMLGADFLCHHRLLVDVAKSILGMLKV